MQSAPAALDPPALPPVSEDDARFLRFLRPVTLIFDLSIKLKIGTPLCRAVGKVYSNFDLSVFLCFRVTSPVRDRRTDGRTSKTHNAACRTAA